MKNKLIKFFILKPLLMVILALVLMIVGFANLQSVSAQDKEKKNEENCLINCPLPPFIVNKFGAVNDEVEMARLDQFASQIRSSGNATAYIVYYGGKINKRGEFQERIKRIKFYLSKVMKLDLGTIKIVHGGFRENFEFELWLSYIENSFPVLSPTLEPEKVKFAGKMKPLSYCCL